jgi:hypothetical protein
MKEIDKKKISSIVYFNNLILKELKDKGINCWVAGGVLRDYFSDIPLNSDCDIFFSNINDFNKAKNYLKFRGATTIWESENGMKINYNDNTYDLVKIFTNNPSETINKFDFTISMFATDGQKLYYGDSSFKDLKDKQLVINKISNPLSTFKRVLKHYRKGFTMSANETKKLYATINELPFENDDFLLNATGSSGENLVPPNGATTTTTTSNTEPATTTSNTEPATTTSNTEPATLKTNNFIEKNKKYLLISLALVVGYIVFNKSKK